MMQQYPQRLRATLRRQHERAFHIQEQVARDLEDRVDFEAAMIRGLADGAESAYDKLAGPKDLTPIACYDTLADLASDRATALTLLHVTHPTMARAFMIGYLDGYAYSCRAIHDAYQTDGANPAHERV